MMVGYSYFDIISNCNRTYVELKLCLNLVTLVPIVHIVIVLM